MDAILNNLQTPSWWFTGLFFLFFVWALKQIATLSLSLLKRLLKSRRLKRLRFLRSTRDSQLSVTYQIISAQNYFIAFLLVCGLYVFWYTVTPFPDVIKSNYLVGAILLLPIYVFEIVWLIKDDLAKSLIKEHQKVIGFKGKNNILEGF